MGSYADHLFASYAWPSLMRQLGEFECATYEMGSVLIRDIKVIAEDVNKVMAFDDGVLVRRTTIKLVASTDKFSPYGGIPQPQAKGTWTFRGAQWAVDGIEGEGITEITPTSFKVSLVRSEPASKSAEGYRN